ncbi:MAG: TonB-dependent receptor [Myxococcales bacterium]|nr:TonB-dependent receptor [Myxococcales bacterium]
MKPTRRAAAAPARLAHGCLAALLSLCCAEAARADDARAPEAKPAAPAPAPQVTRPPELLQAAAPDYPPAALAAGKQAVVKIKLHLDEVGVVTKVDVLEPVGDGFDEAAVAAAMQYVFSPAEIDGKPAAIAVETAINFVIEEAPEPEPEPDFSGGNQVSDGPPNHAGRMSAPITLQGEVVERGTRSKQAGVTVSIAELGLDAVTGERGDFYFHGVPPGTYRVIAVGDRFDRLERPIELIKGEQLEIRLWARPRGGNPYETVVEGAREVLEVTRRTLRRQQLTSVPGTFGDPIRVIQSLPGVARTPFGLGLLLIRGSNPDDTGVFIDGHEVPLLFHFLGGPSIINAEMIESIDLYPGGFPGRFGRHHGGVVAIETRPAATDGVHGSADVDFLDSGGYLRAPLGKRVMLSVAGRRSYIDVFLPLVLPDNGQVVVPVYYDYQARLDVDLRSEGKLSVTLLGSADTLDVLSDDPDDEESLNLNSAIRFFRLIGTYRRPISRTLSLSMSPAYGRDSVSFAGGQAEAAGPFTSVDISQTALSYRARVSGKLGGAGLAGRLTLDTGLDLLSRVTSYEALVPINDDVRNGNDIDTPPELTLRGTEELAVGAYVDLGIDVTSRLRVVPSLRLDAYNLDGNFRSSFDPRLSARYQLGQGWTGKAYLGLFHQPPQPEAFDPQFGTPSIEQELGTHYGVGAEWKPDKLWSFDGEFYYIDRDNLVIFEGDRVQNEDGTFTQINFSNDSYRRAYGFEVLLRREVSERAYGWLSYTFAKSTQQRGDGPTTATNFDQPHTLNAVASWKPGAGFELGLRFRLTSGRPETPVTGANFDADAGRYNPVRTDIRSRRTPAFHQLDVRAERTWLFHTWSIGLYLDVQNLYNSQNVEATRYDYRFRDSARVTSVPFLPTLGVRGQW